MHAQVAIQKRLLLILSTMSSLLRLQWLTAEIHHGRCAQVSFSYNAQSRKEKIKFTLDSSYGVAGVYRPLLFGALLAAQHALDSSITTDKGHKSSDGITVVEFWCQQLPEARTDVTTAVVQQADVIDSKEAEKESEKKTLIPVPSVPDSTDILERIEAIKGYLASSEATTKRGMQQCQILERLEQTACDPARLQESKAKVYNEQRINAEKGVEAMAELNRLTALLDDS